MTPFNTPEKGGTTKRTAVVESRLDELTARVEELTTRLALIRTAGVLVERITLTGDLADGEATADILEDDGSAVIKSGVTVYDWGQVPADLGGSGAKGFCILMKISDGVPRREILVLDCTETS